MTKKPPTTRAENATQIRLPPNLIERARTLSDEINTLTVPNARQQYSPTMVLVAALERGLAEISRDFSPKAIQSELVFIVDEVMIETGLGIVLIGRKLAPDTAMPRQLNYDVLNITFEISYEGTNENDPTLATLIAKQSGAKIEGLHSLLMANTPFNLTTSHASDTGMATLIDIEAGSLLPNTHRRTIELHQNFRSQVKKNREHGYMTLIKNRLVSEVNHVYSGNDISDARTVTISRSVMLGLIEKSSDIPTAMKFKEHENSPLWKALIDTLKKWRETTLRLLRVSGTGIENDSPYLIIKHEPSLNRFLGSYGNGTSEGLSDESARRLHTQAE